MSSPWIRTRSIRWWRSYLEQSESWTSTGNTFSNREVFWPQEKWVQAIVEQGERARCWIWQVRIGTERRRMGPAGESTTEAGARTAAARAVLRILPTLDVQQGKVLVDVEGIKAQLRAAIAELEVKPDDDQKHWHERDLRERRDRLAQLEEVSS